MQSVKRKLPPTASKLGASVDKALAQATRLKDLIEGMLDFAKLESGKTTLQREPVELGGLVREVIDDRLLDGRNAIHFQAPERPIVGRWDPIRLEQVIGNILDNAIKFGGGQPIEVQISANSRDAFIAIKDQGIGIPKDQIEKIFGHFERVESAQSYPGLGIGLSVAAEFAERLGGEIKVESAPHEGSTFTIRLPLRPSANGDNQ
jgi:signal transduction histidine kinase